MSVTLRPKSASNWTSNGPASTVVFANAWRAMAAPAMPIRTGPTTWAQRGIRAMAGTVAAATANSGMDGSQAGWRVPSAAATSRAVSMNDSRNGDVCVRDQASP